MKYIKDFLLSAFSGIITLVIINLMGAYTGVILFLSYINIFISGLLGIPGVILLLVAENIIIK